MAKRPANSGWNFMKPPRLRRTKYSRRGADLLEDRIHIVDRTVIRALLDDGDTERAFALPSVFVLDEGLFLIFSRIKVSSSASWKIGRSSVGVAIGLEKDRDGATEKQRPCTAALWLLRSKSTRSPSATSADSTILFEADVPLSTK